MPAEIRNAGLDMAEAIFGIVRDKAKGDAAAIKGRLEFEDLTCRGAKLDPGKPVLLSSPKPTCYPHYLTQNSDTEKTSYFAGDFTTIRGTKMYWHRPGAQVQAEGSDAVSTTLDALVPKGAEFRGRLHFHNLNDWELGALLAALCLPANCRHHLGMGKPLGFGSVQLSATLHLVDPERRYSAWAPDGAIEANGNSAREAFNQLIESHAQSCHEPVAPSPSTTFPTEPLARIARLETMYLMLRFNGAPKSGATAVMPLERFKEKLILPTPHAVAGAAEPKWAPSPPKAGPARKSRTAEGNRSPNPAPPLSPAAAGNATRPVPISPKFPRR